MMMERERFPHPALMAHEEFIRYWYYMNNAIRKLIRMFIFSNYCQSCQFGDTYEKINQKILLITVLKLNLMV